MSCSLVELGACDCLERVDIVERMSFEQFVDHHPSNTPREVLEALYEDRVVAAQEAVIPSGHGARDQPARSTRK